MPSIKLVRVREGHLPAKRPRRHPTPVSVFLIDQKLPEVAVRFRRAIWHTLELLRQRPLIGARYQTTSPQLNHLRSWPVARFEAVRIYYLVDDNAIRVIRVLHGRRDLKNVLLNERRV